MRKFLGNHGYSAEYEADGAKQKATQQKQPFYCWVQNYLKEGAVNCTMF